MLYKQLKLVGKRKTDKLVGNRIFIISWQYGDSNLLNVYVERGYLLLSLVW